MPKLYEVQHDGRWLFHIDHHMLSTNSMCERLFEFKHLLNQRHKGQIPFSWAVGAWWSDVMSDLYEGIAKNQALGVNKPPMLVETLVSAAKHWKKLKMDRFKVIAPKMYEKFGGTKTIALTVGEDLPVEFPSGAMLMAQEYYEHRAEADSRDWRVISTETAFGVLDNLIIGENSKVIVAYQGRPDLLVVDRQDRLMPVDGKTKDYPDPGRLLFEYKPHPQTAGYVFALNQLVRELGIKNRTVDRCVVIVSGRLPPTQPRKVGEQMKSRFCQIYVPYSQSELEEWKEQVIGKVTRLRQAIESGLFLIKESSCHYQYGSPCEFRPVCSQPPNARERILRRDYEEIRPWDTSKPEERSLVKEEITK